MSPSGHLERNTRTRARTNDIQKLHEKFPWATSVDHLLFLEGWDKGDEWGRRNSDCDKQLSDSSTYS